MNEKSIQTALQNLPINEIRFYDVIDSTNEEAKRWMDQGLHKVALVAADEQSAGRGRASRRWITKKGAAIAASLIIPSKQTILQPAISAIIEAGMLLRLTAVGALSVREAIQKHYGIQAEIKWPNDVWINNKKVCGILTEAVWSGDALQGAVIGIGVNVTKQSVPDPEALDYPATCIECEAGQAISRLELLQQILEAFFRIYPHILEKSFLTDWENALAMLGEKVIIQYEDAKSGLVGKILGLSPEGA